MAKRISLYGILAALCIVISFVEHLISFDFIAPGVKLGLSNSVALLLILKGDIKGAFGVNVVRIILSSLLFSAPSTLIYSLTAGIVSIICMSIVSRVKNISVIGFSVLGAALHNITQLLVAFWLLGRGVLYYTPFLLISAVLSGAFTGFASKLISDRVNFRF